MAWQPISEHKLLDEIDSAYWLMSPEERLLWERIRIPPQKWQQHPYGDEGGGFWVAAIIGNTIIWYNDIEEGWNFSNYEQFGHFSEYECNQSDLKSLVKHFREQLIR